MPSKLALRKPNETQLCQKSWRGTIPAMAKALQIDGKPFQDIAERIRWHREQVEKVNQADYGKRAGLKRSQVSNWETGDSRVSIDGALSLRETYGLSLDFIYEGIDDALPMTLRAAWRDRPRVSHSK